MREKLLALLEAIERAIPRDPKSHAALVRSDYGTEARLMLIVRPKGAAEPLNTFLDDEDFEKDPEHFAQELAALLLDTAKDGLGQPCDAVPNQRSVARKENPGRDAEVLAEYLENAEKTGVIDHGTRLRVQANSARIIEKLRAGREYKFVDGEKGILLTPAILAAA
jgi:hypothetical protein